MFYEEILIDLIKNNVQLVLVGGMAVNLHGYDRTTGDLDVLLDMSQENLDKFIHVVQKWGLQPRMPIEIHDFLDDKKRKEWIKEKNMKAFALVRPEKRHEQLDVVLESPISFETAFANGEKISLNDVEVVICSIEDLITMKKCANRTIDKVDIEALKRIQELNGHE